MSIISKLPINKDKKTYHSPEYQQFLKLRLINISVVSLLIIILIIGLYFVYQNIFITIGQAEDIIMAKNNLSSLEVIDFTKFDKVKQNWDEKNQTSYPALTRDPFNPLASSTTSTTIATKH